jgi:hypothetical protein
MMPRLDGYQTCALIKKNPKFSATPRFPHRTCLPDRNPVPRRLPGRYRRKRRGRHCQGQDRAPGPGADGCSDARPERLPGHPHTDPG